MPSAGHLRCARVRNVSRTRSAVARGVRTLESVAGHVRASSSMCDGGDETRRTAITPSFMLHPSRPLNTHSGVGPIPIIKSCEL